VRAGAPRAATRTFLIPEARLAKRFGIAETVGPFASTARAHGLVRSITAGQESGAARWRGPEHRSSFAPRLGWPAISPAPFFSGRI